MKLALKGSQPIKSAGVFLVDCYCLSDFKLEGADLLLGCSVLLLVLVLELAVTVLLLVDLAHPLPHGLMVEWPRVALRRMLDAVSDVLELVFELCDILI